MLKGTDSRRSPGSSGLPRSLKHEIREYICTHFLPGDHGVLRDGDLLFEGGLIDSAGAMSFIDFLQDRYGIEVLDEELFPDNFATVNHTCRFVLKKLAGKRDG